MKIFYTVLIILAGIALLALLAYFGSRTSGHARRESAGDKKGKRGETQVSSVLETCKIKGDILLANVVLGNKKTGASTEIDHILLSTRGIFVIETKTRAGEIRGSDRDATWEQILGNGDIHHMFRSPVLQNEGHVSKVKAVAKCDAAENVVVFAEGNIEKVKSKFVHTLADLPAFFASRPQGVLTADERDRAGSRLVKAAQESVSPEEHRRKMQKRYGDKE